MSTEVAGRERRRIPIRAPLTGLVLVLIVVLGTYYGWQAAFGTDDGAGLASDGCDTTSPPTATATTGTPGTPVAPPATTATVAVVPAAVTTTIPPTSSLPPTAGVLLPADVTVNVYNSTVRRGLANNTAAVLRERGFDIADVGNDTLGAEILEVAQLRAASADMPEVRLLIQHIPGAVIIADGRTNSEVDLVIGEAFVALGDPATVTPVPIATPRC